MNKNTRYGGGRYCSIDDCDNKEIPLHWSEYKLININGTTEEIVCNDCIEELEN